MRIFATLVFAAVCLSGQAQQTYKGPVDYDYDNIQTITLSGSDEGNEFQFTTRTIDDGDRTLYIPVRKDLGLHERELFLYAYNDKVIAGNNVKREDPEERVDTTNVMSFKVKRLPMGVAGVPQEYDGNIEIEMSLEPADTTKASIFEFSNVDSEKLTVALDYINDKMEISLGDSIVGNCNFLHGIDPDDDTKWRIHLYLSKNTIELFINDGRIAFSRSISLQHQLRQLTMKSVGGVTMYSGIAFYKRTK